MFISPRPDTKPFPSLTKFPFGGHRCRLRRAQLDVSVPSGGWAMSVVEDELAAFADVVYKFCGILNIKTVMIGISLGSSGREKM